MNVCRSGLRAAAVLIPLLGLTWVIGVFAIDTLSMPLTYLFTILNSLQVWGQYVSKWGQYLWNVYVYRGCLCSYFTVCLIKGLVFGINQSRDNRIDQCSVQVQKAIKKTRQKWLTEKSLVSEPTITIWIDYHNPCPPLMIIYSSLECQAQENDHLVQYQLPYWTRNVKHYSVFVC